MLYLDTSVVVAAITNEQDTIGVQIWLARQNVDQLSISTWTVAEVSSALSLKVRTAELDLDERRAAAARFDDLVSNGFRTVDVTPQHFKVAARFTENHALGLRASDALHLAIAADHRAKVFSLDHRMLKAGPSLGIATQLPLF